MSDTDVAAIVTSSYCMAVIAPSNYATYSAPRDYASDKTRAASCEKYSTDNKMGATGSAVEKQWVGDVSCGRIYRDEKGNVETIRGRLSSYFNTGADNCDWCCCQLK